MNRLLEILNIFEEVGYDMLDVMELGLQNSPVIERPAENSGYFSDSSLDSDEETFRNKEFTYLNNNDKNIFYD